MYINHLMTDRELIDTAQYAENPQLRLLAERLDDKLVIIRGARLLAERLDDKLAIIRDARDALSKAYKIEMSDDVSDLINMVQDILER